MYLPSESALHPPVPQFRHTQIATLVSMQPVESGDFPDPVREEPTEGIDGALPVAWRTIRLQQFAHGALQIPIQHEAGASLGVVPECKKEQKRLVWRTATVSELLGLD